MPSSELWVIGAGGHGKVVADALAVASQYFILCDSDVDRIGSIVLGREVRRQPEVGDFIGRPFHVAIGRGDIRRSLHEVLQKGGGLPCTVSHTRATIAASALVGGGCFLAAHSIVGPSASLGVGVIVNHGAVVDHDCSVGDFSHIAPNATLGGNVCIGALCLVGAGATILPGVRIGEGAKIAAGATIFRNVAAGETVIFELKEKKR